MTADNAPASTPGGRILGWWSKQLGDRETGAAKALAARLRRRSAIEILCEPEVHKLAAMLQLRDAERLLRLVRVLAELRGHNETPLARRLGVGGDDPLLSHARFDRLMRSDGEELTTALVRAIRMLGPNGRTCNIARLGADLLFWNDRTRTSWAFDYFQQPAPAAGEANSPEEAA